MYVLQYPCISVSVTALTSMWISAQTSEIHDNMYSTFRRLIQKTLYRYGMGHFLYFSVLACGIESRFVLWVELPNTCPQQAGYQSLKGDLKQSPVTVYLFSHEVRAMIVMSEHCCIQDMPCQRWFWKYASVCSWVVQRGLESMSCAKLVRHILGRVKYS